MLPRNRSSIRSRTVLALALLAGLESLAAGTAHAAPPERDGFANVISPFDGSTRDIKPDRGGDPTAAGAPKGSPRAARGFDVSYPQCGAAYPSNPAFAIVGVNGGRVFSTNSCLASQLAWGRDAAAELYINTGNPGPALSSFWPNGQTSPRLCAASNNDTVDCAYDYGWNAAAQSYSVVEQAYAARGITANPNLTVWWLDVETENSWRSNTSLNVAALQGEVDYVRSRGVARLGFYSTTVQWTTITGGSKVFSAFPSWGAGSPSEKAAQDLCARTVTSFTGGRLAMVQYPYSGFDADLRC